MPTAASERQVPVNACCIVNEQRGIHDNAYACIIRRLVCGNSQMFFVWFGSDVELDLFEYSDEQINSYQPSSEYLDWAVQLDLEAPAFDQVVQLRHIVPHAC